MMLRERRHFATDRILGREDFPRAESRTLPQSPSHRTEHRTQIMIRGGILRLMEY